MTVTPALVCVTGGTQQQQQQQEQQQQQQRQLNPENVMIIGLGLG
jgi:hypothetical protein